MIQPCKNKIFSQGT